MTKRVELQRLLEALLGSQNVYFQPPESYKMNYPCIVYHRDNVEIEHADNKPYAHRKKYQLTIIDKNPDSTIPDRIEMIPTCNFNRHFTADALNHDVYSIYF